MLIVNILLICLGLIAVTEILFDTISLMGEE